VPACWCTAEQAPLQKAMGLSQMMGVGEKGLSSSSAMNGGVVIVVSGVIVSGTGGGGDVPRCIVVITNFGFATGWCGGEGGRVVVILGIGSCSAVQKIARNCSW